MSIRDRFYQKLQESREQLDELRKPKDIDKLRKHMGDAAQAASDAAYKKGSDHYDETARKRKKAISTKSPQDMDDATAEQKKMSDAWKRSIAFGKIADRKKKELEEEQLDELSDPTHMSYRAKARNQLDKMVNRLGSKMGSDTVNTKKMKNRAEGIKKSYKLQPKKK